MTLECRIAPGNLLGEMIALAIPAQVGSLLNLASENAPGSSAPALANAVPSDAPPIDPGVTLTSLFAPVGETFTTVAAATLHPATAPFDPALNDALFASPTPTAPPLAPSAEAPSPNPGASGGPSASSVEPAPQANSAPPPAPSIPPPVVPPPGMNPPTPPTANNDAYTVTNGTLSVPASGVLANDTSPGGQPMTATLVNPTVFGVVALNGDGSFTYNANPGISGTDSFTYQVTAGGQTSNPATVNLTVSAAPLRANDDAYTVHGRTLTVPASGVLGNDTNPGGQPMTASLVRSTVFGVVALSNDGSFTYNYTANPGTSGTDSFTYQVTAGGQTSNVATVSLTIPAPTPPTANDDAYTVNGGTLTVSASGVMDNDTNPDGQPMTATLVASASHGTAMLSSDGSFTYTATPGYLGTDSFTYQVTAGGLTSNVATVTMTIGPAIPPTANDDGYALPPNGGTLTVSSISGLLTNDDDPDGQGLTPVLDASPAHGMVTLNSDGSFSYTANPGTSGSDSFTYHVTEGTLTSNVATVTLTAGTASVDGHVWIDSNGDGIHDAIEPEMPGVAVELLDVAGSVIATTVTDSTGYYQFTGVVAAASYQVEVVVPEGYEPTTKGVGPPAYDSDVDGYGFTDVFYVAAAATTTTLDAGVKPAAAAVGAVIQIRDDGSNVTNKLRVAKWENAFEKKPGATGISVKDDFLLLDPDHFYVYVIDAAANKDLNAIDKITVHVKTDSDTGTDITLVETGINTGRFWSKKWLLLISVTGDRYDGDANFMVKLGDTVTASYTKGTTTVNATATVPIEKVVKLHINILRDLKLADGGKQVLSPATVEDYVRVANLIYAPVGIKFTYAAPAVVDPPRDVILTDGLTRYQFVKAGTKIPMTDEEKALLGAGGLRTAATDDIEVYVVNYFTPRSEGESFWATGVPDAKYADSVIIRGPTEYVVLAHEIGHVLMDNGDHPDANIGYNRVNLMAAPPPTVRFGDVTANRRITAAQAKLMLSKRSDLLSKP